MTTRPTSPRVAARARPALISWRRSARWRAFSDSTRAARSPSRSASWSACAARRRSTSRVTPVAPTTSSCSPSTTSPTPSSQWTDPSGHTQRWSNRNGRRSSTALAISRTTHSRSSGCSRASHASKVPTNVALSMPNSSDVCASHSTRPEGMSHDQLPMRAARIARAKRWSSRGFGSSATVPLPLPRRTRDEPVWPGTAGPAFNTCVSSAYRAQPDRVQSIAK